MPDQYRKAERIPGGLAKGKRPEDFDPKQLSKGIKVEMEHTSDKEVAREIAMDHLTEFEDYYDRLEKIEGHKASALRVALRKCAGWWAISEDSPGITPPPVDKGGLMNAIPGTDPGDAAMYNGDGPADTMGEALDSIAQQYWSSWGRPPHPEEIQAVFDFVSRPVFEGAYELVDWFPRLVAWFKVPADSINLSHELVEKLGWFFKQDASNQRYGTFPERAEDVLELYRRKLMEAMSANRRSWEEGDPLEDGLMKSLQALQTVKLDENFRGGDGVVYGPDGEENPTLGLDEALEAMGLMGKGMRVASAMNVLLKRAAYYRLKPGTSVKEVIRRWMEERDKAYEDSMPVGYSPRELSPHKEYRWTREKSRAGYARVGGKNVWLEGPLKWDALAEDMRSRGWDDKDPLHLHIGGDGSAKIGEGNHRLAIAEKIGLGRVPVMFHFYQGKVVKNVLKDDKPVVVAPRALKNVVEKAEKRGPMAPEEKEQVDDLMSLLGF
jgi:hypothetical protein